MGTEPRNALGLWVCFPGRSSLGSGLIVPGIRGLGGKVCDHWPEEKVS